MPIPRYQISVFWDAAAEAFAAEVVELPGCRATGATSREAIQNVGPAIERWIAAAEAEGRPIPAPQHPEAQ